MAIKHKKLILGVFAAILSLGFFSIFSSPAYAEIVSSGESIHLQISPVKQKLKLKPGQTQVSSIKVMNIGTEKFTYTVSVAPYSVVDEKYNPNYENKTGDYTKMTNWITIDEKLKTGTIEPKTAIDVPFTITVPSDVPSGGQYAAIMAETSDGSKPNSVIKTVNRLGMILYADIAGGSIRESGEIVNNNVSSFVLEPPFSVTSTVENTGNVESVATYTVRIWPFGSNETVFSNEQNPSKLDIIPKTRRFNTITWDGAPKLGLFTVEQKIEYLGKTSVVKKLVLICPFWLMLIFIIIIVALVSWLVIRIMKRKKANTSKE